MWAVVASAPEWVQAIVLGIVQGATEFIPVSSSGHLVIVPYVLGWDRPGLAFDVALHVGTVGAIIAYFRAELRAMANAVVRPGAVPDGELHRRLALLLVAATVPVGIAGILLRDLVESAFEEPRLAAGMLLVTAALLVGGEALRRRRIESAASRRRVFAGGDDEGDATHAPVAGEGETALPMGDDPDDPSGTTLRSITLRQAVMVGCGQALALLPGLSRSGTTITTGLAAGLTRAAAARFSFLMALPALVGAAVVSLPDLSEPSAFSGVDIAAGVLAAFLAGYAAVAFLVKLVSRTGLHLFSIYLVAASAATFLLAFVR